jgi:RNA recognition motif-containing protein
MKTKVRVDNLAASITESDLTRMFSIHGNVMSVHIALDPASHKPRGFGFVTMVTPEAAQAAIQALNGELTPAGQLSVSEA